MEVFSPPSCPDFPRSPHREEARCTSRSSTRASVDHPHPRINSSPRPRLRCALGSTTILLSSVVRSLMLRAYACG